MFGLSVLRSGKELFLDGEVEHFNLDEKWGAVAVVGDDSEQVRMDLQSLRDRGGKCSCGHAEVKRKLQYYSFEGAYSRLPTR